VDLKQNFDSYLVKFWIQDKKTGYWVQESRVECLQGKDKHEQAANIVESRFLVPIKIISVVYQ
jgi:hypothetical protein